MASETGKPSQKSEKAPVLAEFSIDNRTFVVRRALPTGRKDARARGTSPGRTSATTGEIVIEKKRYLILEEGGCVPGHQGKEKSLLELLTGRELQIIILVAKGHVNKEIAHRLSISEWTVSTHMRRIFAKLGVDSRAAMVYRCYSAIGDLKKYCPDISSG